MSNKRKKLLEEERFLVKVDRELSLSQSDLWNWVTKPELTGQWIGPWQPVDEENLQITLIQEEGSPTFPAKILEFNEPFGYTLELGGMGVPWVILVTVAPSGQNKSLFSIIQTIESKEAVPATQAGWEFYADCLIAAIEDRAMPRFKTYWQSVQ